MEPIEEKYRQLMNDIGRMLDNHLNPDPTNKETGFCLFMFDFTTHGRERMNYLSNAQRADMLTALKEFIARHEGRAPDQEGHA